MSTTVVTDRRTRKVRTQEWIQVDPPEDYQPTEGMSTLRDRWVRVDPVDDLLAQLRGPNRLHLKQHQVRILRDILGGWAPEEEIMSERAVQEGIDEAIREFEEWKDSLPG